jgi:hypothetical protein
MIVLSPAAAQAATTPPGPAVVVSTDTARAQLLAPVVTVRSGQYLSQIAAEDCGTPADWTGIFAANKTKISNPDLIYAGEQLALSCRQAPVPVIAARTDAVTASSPRQYHHRYVSAQVVSTSGMSGFQACVIRAESGGNSQVMNSSGHYGLYQFSSSTWAAHGGNPADFGHAGAAEQTQVFWNTVHADGTSDWSPYDGC